MHSVTGPAITFKDGWRLWYVNGVNFSEEDFNKFILGKPKAEEILAIENIEQRAAVIDTIGYGYMLEHLPKCKTIFEGFDFKGKPGRIFEFEWHGRVQRLVEFTDSTDGEKVYQLVERVPLTKTLIGCQAWCGGRSKVEDYCPVVET